MTAERAPDACTPGPGGSCALCADAAAPGRVMSADPEAGTAVVSFAGVVATVALDLVDGVRVGDTVLVHQGFAIARVGEAGGAA